MNFFETVLTIALTAAIIWVIYTLGLFDFIRFAGAIYGVLLVGYGALLASGFIVVGMLGRIGLSDTALDGFDRETLIGIAGAVGVLAVIIAIAARFMGYG